MAEEIIERNKQFKKECKRARKEKTFKLHLSEEKEEFEEIINEFDSVASNIKW